VAHLGTGSPGCGHRTVSRSLIPGGWLVGVLGRVDRDPLPHHCTVEGTADNPVNLPDRGVREPAAHVRLAGPPTRVAASRVRWHTRRSIVLVAAVRLAGPVLQVWPAVAVVTASPELRVEGVQGFHLELGQGKRSERGPDVLADFAVVARLVDGSTSRTWSHLSRSCPRVARVRGLRFWSTWCRSRVRTFSAWSPAFGPAGTTSVRYIRRLEIGSTPLYTRTRRAPEGN